MLHIYTDYPKEEYILSNDQEFELHTITKVLSDTTGMYKEYISKIEGVKFCSDDRIISSINNEPISLLDISTGCKTIINILCNPNKIVFAIECGKNYSDYIYQIKQGKIYLPDFLIPRNRENFLNTGFSIHKGDNIIKIKGIKDLERWYQDNNE